jgi:hypothetical protein
MLAVLVGGCWRSESEDRVTPVLPPRSAPAESSPRPHRDAVFDGFYMCAQGKTALTLTLRYDADIDARTRGLVGTFEFGPLPENPGVPHGNYTLRGTAGRTDAGTYEITMTPDGWLEHPDHYYMVGLRAILDDERDSLRGAITDPNCGEVVLARRR